MNLFRKTIVSAMAAAIMGGAFVSVPAMARESVGVTFDSGNVRMGYRDGYWDNDHNWHKWRNSRETREFRNHYQDRYMAERHSHYPNHGWRDRDDR